MLADRRKDPGLITLADGIISQDEIDKRFSILFPGKDSKKIRNLMNKFIHGQYSGLFELANISFKGLKPTNFADLIDKLRDLHEEAGVTMITPERAFFNLVSHEQVALNFLLGVFACLSLVYFERLQFD